jgi:hypothetical protein
MATYVFKEGEGKDMKLVPITNFFDIDGFFEYLGELTQELKEANKSRIRKVKRAAILGKLLWNVRKYYDKEKAPKGVNFIGMLSSATTGGNYHGLADFHKNSLFIGMMHFQDPYNWDIDRIHKCDIHYATPDGKVIPFCTFNVIPEMYRDKIQRKFSIPASEWERRTGKKIADEKHHRKWSKEEMDKMKAYYDQFRMNLRKPQLEPDWGYDEINFDEMKANEQVSEGEKEEGHVEQLVMIGGAGKTGTVYTKKHSTMENPAAGSAGCSSGTCGC